MLTPDEIITALGMRALPTEGGYFVESYRSVENLTEGALPDSFGAPRSLATAIYYLLTPGTFSAMHRLRSDEVYHFYLGDPVEMLNLYPGGEARTITLGSDLLRGTHLQAVVPRDVWQGSRLVSGGKYALMGTTMAPGFDPADYEHGKREDLLRSFPEARGLITALTRE